MSDRLANDAYYTPDYVARACVGALNLSPGCRVLEPSIGAGAYLRALQAQHEVSGVDVDPAAPALTSPDLVRSWCADFETVDLGDYRPDWVIGNPPFSHAQAHAERALKLARVGVALLLRQAFLESAKRRAFWAKHPPARVLTLVERPSFVSGGRGTDSSAYALFIWHRHHGGPWAGGFLETPREVPRG